MSDEDFFSFVCPSCHSELEVTPDMIGERTECPACGAGITVPDPKAAQAAPVPPADGVVRHGLDTNAKAKSQAMKSRTLRIELGDF